MNEHSTPAHADVVVALLHVTPPHAGVTWAQVLARVYENENIPQVVRDMSTETLWTEYKAIVAAGMINRTFTNTDGFAVTYTRTESGEKARQDMARQSKAAQKLAAPAQRETKAQRHGTQTDKRIPAPGQALVRQYNGHEYKAIVRQNGFEYAGKLYGSLRAVAMKITGYKSISGHQFFGLAPRSGKLPAKPATAAKVAGKATPAAKRKAPRKAAAKRKTAKAPAGKGKKKSGRKAK